MRRHPGDLGLGPDPTELERYLAVGKVTAQTDQGHADHNREPGP